MKTIASVAQLVEQGTENPRVVGSIPTGGTIYADLAHLVERHLAKVEVASSSLVIRSTIKALSKYRRRFFFCSCSIPPVPDISRERAVLFIGGTGAL